MKHKLFSMLFAVCAACVSVTGLTSCDGEGVSGNEENVSLGAMTVKEFASARYHFELNQAIRGFIGLTDRASVMSSTSVTGEGMFIADGGGSRARCRVTYQKLDSTGEPTYQLNISFDQLNSVSDAAILGALGIANAGNGDTNISSEIRIIIYGSNFMATGNIVTDLDVGGDNANADADEEGGEAQGGGAQDDENNGLAGEGTIFTVKGNITDAY